MKKYKSLAIFTLCALNFSPQVAMHSPIYATYHYVAVSHPYKQAILALKGGSLTIADTITEGPQPLKALEGQYNRKIYDTTSLHEDVLNIYCKSYVHEDDLHKYDSVQDKKRLCAFLTAKGISNRTMFRVLRGYFIHKNEPTHKDRAKITAFLRQFDIVPYLQYYRENIETSDIINKEDNTPNRPRARTSSAVSIKMSPSTASEEDDYSEGFFGPMEGIE